MLRAPDLAGRALDDRYELHDAIGEGAFGRVYRGLDRRLERPVAVKVIKPWWAEDSGWVERFQREAQLLARVNDPGIVQIFDIGDAEEGPYYVAELVDGESLAARLRRGPLPPAEARAVAEKLCRALASAHAQGVVHCDVKPANVLLAPGGAVKVGDFGLARLADRTSQAATVAGTPRYMAPEQARGRPTTPATDVYSAGVVLYEMLAGEPPFVAGSAVELGLRHVQDEPPPLPPSVPADLRRILARALAKDPAKRFSDAAGMARALHDADPDSRAGADSLADARPGAGSDARGSAAPRAPATPGADPDARTVAVPRRRTPRRGRADWTAATRVIAKPATVALTGSGGAGPPRAPRASGTRDPGPPGRRRLRGRRVLLLAAALLAAGAVVAALLLTGSPGHTTVPELRGLPRGGVEARARRLHVRPMLSSRHSEVTAGIAIAQRPAAGARVSDGASVDVVLSSGPPPVSVPKVVGQPSAAAESAVASAGLRYSTALVAAPGTAPDLVTRQSPSAAAVVPRGTTIALSIAETPRWRALTSFSGSGSGRSVPVRILGRRWRVSYSMSYSGTCVLLLVCLGPSAQARNLRTDSTLGGFELGEGSSQTHTFDSGPGLYRVEVSSGQDSARWSMTVEDYY